VTRDAPGGGLPRIGAAVLALVLLFVAATLLRPPPTSGPFARDFEAYYAAGATWNAGGNPWSRAIWAVERTIPGVDARRDELLPYVGPATALPLFGALARLPQPLAVRVWTVLLGCALAAVVLASLALAQARGLFPIVGGLVLALAAAPATSDLELGQAALLAVAGVACALVAYERRGIVAGTIATLLASIQPNVALVLLARLRDRTSLVAAACALTIFGGVTLAAGGGVAGVCAYARLLGTQGRAERFDAIQYTPAAIAWALGAPRDAAITAGLVVALVAVAAVIVAIVRLRLSPRDATLLAIAALPLAVPFFHEHDFVIELIPLIILAAVTRGRLRAWSGVAAALILVDWLALAQRVPAQPAIVLQGIAAACAFAALGPTQRLRRADLAAPIAVCIAALVAVPLARAFPIPDWPDALPARFAVPASMAASDVWAAEQHATGLFAPIPAWGALRTLPLGGCVILGIAIAANRRRGARRAISPRYRRS
jgi:hypothetical protein